jgi:hypothetical protein
MRSDRSAKIANCDRKKQETKKFAPREEMTPVCSDAKSQPNSDSKRQQIFLSLSFLHSHQNIDTNTIPLITLTLFFL